MASLDRFGLAGKYGNGEYRFQADGFILLRRVSEIREVENDAIYRDQSLSGLPLTG